MSARTLKDKVAVIAGGGKNLGALIAHNFADAGVRGLALHYNSDASRTDTEATAAALQAKVTPIYEEMEGWHESTQGARSWADLPAAAIKYVRRVEELIGAPAAMVSTSPQRDDTIMVRDPFQD